VRAVRSRRVFHRTTMLRREKVGPMGAILGRFGGKVWQCKEVLGWSADHAGRDTRTKLEDLASNVTEESVRGPATNEHDGENGDSGEVHGHGSAGSKGVSADVFGGETQDILAEARSSRAKLCSDKSASDELALVMRDDSADWAVRVTSRVAENALNKASPLSDGT
jgi:hypothetical protein